MRFYCKNLLIISKIRRSINGKLMLKSKEYPMFLYEKSIIFSVEGNFSWEEFENKKNIFNNFSTNIEISKDLI